MDKYTLGQCQICGKTAALKNNVCVDCEKGIEVPDFIEDLFKGDKDE